MSPNYSPDSKAKPRPTGLSAASAPAPVPPQSEGEAEQWVTWTLPFMKGIYSRVAALEQTVKEQVKTIADLKSALKSAQTSGEGMTENKVMQIVSMAVRLDKMQNP